jgi:hypothetical protein
MTPAQEAELFSTLKRLERNTTLAVRGLQLMCTEMGIRRELNKVLDEIDKEAENDADSSREGGSVRTTMPAPPNPDDEVKHGQ